MKERNISDSTVNRPSVMLIAVLFSAFFILANLSAFKLVQYAFLSFPASLIFFPITFIFGDILTEVYGFQVARRIIWYTVLANSIVVLGTLLTVYLQPSPLWHGQSSYEAVYQVAPRIFIGSVVSFLAGEFVNSMILAKLKVRMAGKHLWLRVVASTAVGAGIDSVVFIHAVFLFVLPYADLWSVVLSMYGLKMVYEIIAVPLTYKISSYLKRKDNVDYYDRETRFNPCSFRVD